MPLRLNHDIVKRLREIDKLLTKAELAAVLMVSVGRIDTAIQRGSLPKGKALSNGRTMWRSTELADWIEARLHNGDDLCGMADVARLIGRHQATLRSYINTGRFPKPDKTIGGRPFWKRKTVLAWLKRETGGVPFTS
jgi:predicted DNA-binding transcriptional regulator AlpA